MIEHLYSFFTFDVIDIIGLALLVVLLIIQIYFYITYYKKPYTYVRKMNMDGGAVIAKEMPKVSVIIASENESWHLSQNLPAILEQDYPDFEVIVVNNGSTDESDYLLQSLKYKYPHLYHTYLPSSNDKKFGRRKLALTIGVKAAKGDILLFTEPYSKPISKKWIASMVANMTEGKEVVLGYSSYKKSTSFFNRVARFDNLLFSMFYISMVLKSKAFTGVYRNLAYKRHLFFDNKGFASYLHLENGEDAFINQIITKDNTAVALSQESFVETSIDNYPLWKQIKKSYSIVKPYFKGNTPFIYSLGAFSRGAFYLLLFVLIVYAGIMQHWALLAISLFIFLIRWLFQYLTLDKVSRYFRTGRFLFSLPLLDIIQPIYNFRFKSQHRGVNGR